jgi:hypothetical protein
LFMVDGDHGGSRKAEAVECEEEEKEEERETGGEGGYLYFPSG